MTTLCPPEDLFYCRPEQREGPRFCHCLSSRTSAAIAEHPRRGRTSILTLFVIPNERSDRGASPKGARDLPLVRTPSSPRSFGHTPGLRMTTLCPPEDLFFCRPEQRDREASPKGKDLDFALACRPERTERSRSIPEGGEGSAFGSNALKPEILRTYPRPQDDNPLSSRGLVFLSS